MKLEKSILNLREEPCDFQRQQLWSKHLGTLEEIGAKTHFVRLTYVLEFKGGLYQNKVNFSLTFALRLGHKAHNFTMERGQWPIVNVRL